MYTRIRVRWGIDSIQVRSQSVLLCMSVCFMGALCPGACLAIPLCWDPVCAGTPISQSGQPTYPDQYRATPRYATEMGTFRFYPCDFSYGLWIRIDSGVFYQSPNQ